MALVIILVIVGVFTISATRTLNPDSDIAISDSSTGRDSLTLSENFYVISNPNWVVYPEILQEHRDESKEYISGYLKRQRDYVKLMFRRGEKYMPKARNIFDRYGVPHEFQVLPALESNFKASAISPAGAAGFWQLMPELAKDYGLRVDETVDERMNFHKSTVAASRFIRDQLKIYDNDPLLVVAAYNAGPGRVNFAIKKSGAKDYWQLQQYLPAETRRFVLRFLALNVVEFNYDKFLANNLNLDAPPTLQIASRIHISDSMLQPPSM